MLPGQLSLNSNNIPFRRFGIFDVSMCLSYFIKNKQWNPLINIYMHMINAISVVYIYLNNAKWWKSRKAVVVDVLLNTQKYLVKHTLTHTLAKNIKYTYMTWWTGLTEYCRCWPPTFSALLPKRGATFFFTKYYDQQTI